MGWWMVNLWNINVIGKYDERFKDDSYIVMYAHGSNLDPFLLASTMPQPIIFLAKSDLWYIPLWNFGLFLMRVQPINRKNFG